MLVYALGIEINRKMLVEEFRRKAYVDVASLVVTDFDGSLIEVVAHADTERNYPPRVKADVMVGIYADTVNLFLPVSIVHCTVHSEEAGSFRTIFLDIVRELLAVHHLDDILVLLRRDTAAVTYMDSFA